MPGAGVPATVVAFDAIGTGHGRPRAATGGQWGYVGTRARGTGHGALQQDDGVARRVHACSEQFEGSTARDRESLREGVAVCPDEVTVVARVQ